jgi:lipooligosaccharide transport system ATP-binding protein
MILGQIPISGGRLSVFGIDLPGGRREVRKRLGVVPQLDNLDPDFTVAENLQVYGSYYGMSRTHTNERLDDLLGFVELRERAHTRINELSGGMKRRLSIARALVSNPEFLVLDEPTTGLDPQVRHLIWRRLRELKKAGKTILITTHYMEEAERLCDELVIMDHGEIIIRGQPKDLVREHVESTVVEIHGESGHPLPDLNQFDCRIESVGGTVYCYADDVAALMGYLESQPGLAVMQRPSNLEDVFVTLTGRELRD